MKLRNHLARFADDASGTVAILFGLCLIVLLCCGALALDSSRTYNVQTKVQAALDAAALAAAKKLDEDGASNQDVIDVAKAFFDTYRPSISMDGLSLSSFEVIPDKPNATVVTKIRASMPSIMADVSGLSKGIEFEASSRATYRSMKFEVALVLDITGSMCDTPPSSLSSGCASGAKLDALKTAAKNMIDALYAANPNPGSVRVSLVPYSAAVNAGSYASAASNGASTDHCVVEREGINAYTNEGPEVGAAATSSASLQPFYFCPTAEVVPLTDLSSPLQRLVFKSKIDAMRGKGGTAGHIGTAWGWYTLSPEWNSLWPGSSAKSYDSRNVLKAVVLMTDGIFNVSYKNGGETYAWPDPSSQDAGNPGTSGYQALKLCDGIRNPADAARSMQLYTVAFQAPSASETLLRTCSGTENFFSADNAGELNDAFKAIVEKLTSLRITS